MNIMKSSMQTSELLSALADGQLRGDEFTQALRTCQHDESALACWNTYHLIGDALRFPVLTAVSGASGTEMEFLARLNTRISQEPGIQLLAGSQEETATSGETFGAPVAAEAHHRGRAANDGSFRWKLVAGLASLAAVSALAWNAAGLLAPSPAPQLAQASSSAQVVVASPQGPMVRDAALEELLVAHRQLGAASVLQDPSGFLRNAAFDLPQDAGR